MIKDMPPLIQLIRLAVPMIGAMASQAIVNLIDTALVDGLGGLALASVSIGSYLAFVLVAALVGLSVGMQSLMSQSVTRSLYPALTVHILLSMTLCALALGVFGYLWAPSIIDAFVVDDRMTGVAIAYFDMRIWGIVGIALSLVIRCYWASQHEPWQFTKVLIFSHLLNIPISYALIYGVGPIGAMGAAGAGLGTTISIYVGLMLHVAVLTGVFQGNRPLRFELLLPLLAKSMVQKPPRNIWRFTLPSGLQQTLFALHMAVLLYLISDLGASALAATFAVFNLGLLLLLPIQGIAQATATLVANSWHHAPAAALSQSRHATALGIIIAVVLTVAIWLGDDQLAALLLTSPDLVALMTVAAPVYALALCFEAITQTGTKAMVSAGNGKIAAIINIAFQWLLLIPLTAWVALHGDFIDIWWTQVGYRAVLALVIWLVWKRFAQAQLRTLT